MAKDMSRQMEALDRIEEAMRMKIDEQIPVLANMPAAQMVTTSQGERALKANPAFAEIRALIRDYIAVVKSIKDMSDGKEVENSDNRLMEIRKKLKVIS